MTRLRDSIKNAEGAAWPEVKREIADAVTPIAIDKLVRTKQSRSNVRFVVEATIQSLAMEGLLRTPADADVIGKAVAWHESFDDNWRPSVDADDEATDVELYDAVEALLAETNGRPRA